MRTNLTTTNARIDALEAKIDLLIAAVQGGSAATPQAAKPSARKSTKTATTAAPKALCKVTRKAFIAASEYDFEGWSTKDIAAFCVTEGYAPTGFVVGPRYTALFSA